MAGSGGDFMRGSFMNKTTSVIVVIGGERLIVLFTAGTVHFPRLLRKVPRLLRKWTRYVEYLTTMEGGEYVWRLKWRFGNGNWLDSRKESFLFFFFLYSFRNVLNNRMQDYLTSIFSDDE